MWSTGCCVSAFWMSFSGVGDVFIPRTLNKKKTPGAPDWEQLFGEGVFLRQWAAQAAEAIMGATWGARWLRKLAIGHTSLFSKDHEELIKRASEESSIIHLILYPKGFIFFK